MLNVREYQCGTIEHEKENLFDSVIIIFVRIICIYVRYIRRGHLHCLYAVFLVELFR